MRGVDVSYESGYLVKLLVRSLIVAPESFRGQNHDMCSPLLRNVFQDLIEVEVEVCDAVIQNMPFYDLLCGGRAYR